MGSEPSTALFSQAHSSSTSWIPTYYTPLVKPIHGLISAFSPVGLGEAIRDKPAQYISMGARVTVRVVPNMEALPCLQTHVYRSRNYDYSLCLLIYTNVHIIAKGVCNNYEYHFCISSIIIITVIIIFFSYFSQFFIFHVTHKPNYGWAIACHVNNSYIMSIIIIIENSTLEKA